MAPCDAVTAPANLHTPAACNTSRGPPPQTPRAISTRKNASLSSPTQSGAPTQYNPPGEPPRRCPPRQPSLCGTLLLPAPSSPHPWAAPHLEELPREPEVAAAPLQHRPRVEDEDRVAAARIGPHSLLEQLPRALDVAELGLHAAPRLPQRQVARVGARTRLEKSARLARAPALLLHDRPRLVDGGVGRVELVAARQQLEAHLDVSRAPLPQRPRQVHVARARVGAQCALKQVAHGAGVALPRLQHRPRLPQRDRRRAKQRARALVKPRARLLGAPQLRRHDRERVVQVGVLALRALAAALDALHPQVSRAHVVALRPLQHAPFVPRARVRRVYDRRRVKHLACRGDVAGAKLQPAPRRPHVRVAVGRRSGALRVEPPRLVVPLLLHQRLAQHDVRAGVGRVQRQRAPQRRLRRAQQPLARVAIRRCLRRDARLAAAPLQAHGVRGAETRAVMRNPQPWARMAGALTATANTLGALASIQMAMASACVAMASEHMATASTHVAMASTHVAMASEHMAMASTQLAMASHTWPWQEHT
eukprot:362458-Chlamydomonas_euryale.AAC.7